MNNSTRSVSNTIFIVIALVIGFAGGVYMNQQGLLPGVTSSNVPPAAQKNFALIAEAWNTIQQNYADRTAINPTNMTYGAISGMVNALGDTGHSRFMSPDERKQELIQIQGQFEGIGAEMEERDGHATVVAPFDGSPAQRAGIKPGDVIIKVNNEDVTELPLTEVVKKVVGPAGTQVTLTILDPATNQTREVTITREKIVIKSVTWQMLPGTTIAHVRLSSFSQDVTKDLVAALQQAKTQGATAIILDLRSNPGGILQEGVGVASQFLSSGNVLQEKDAQGSIKDTPVQPGGVATDIPMVVLVNGGTGSASEIVSGALQDAQRARLVGEKTFGTGTVLLRFDLSDGSSLLLATGEWLTPKGRVIWHQGIQPDVAVTLPDNVQPLFPEEERSMTADQLRLSPDVQLLKALDLLTAK